MLDHLSDGRLDVGFGKGISPPEQILWGVPRDEAAARTEEALDYILSAMKLVAKEGLGCLFSYDGRYWSATEHPLEISPFQQPHPPLWRPGTLATAAQMGVSTIIPGPMNSIPENVEAYREQQNPEPAGGHTPILSTLRRIVVAPTEGEAVTIAERAWATFDANLTKLFREYDLWPPTMVPSFLGDTEKAFATESLVAGSPTQVAEYFERFEQESGLTHVTLCPAFGNITTDEARTTLDLLGDVVIAG